MGPSSDAVLGLSGRDSHDGLLEGTTQPCYMCDSWDSQSFFTIITGLAEQGQHSRYSFLATI